MSNVLMISFISQSCECFIELEKDQWYHQLPSSHCFLHKFCVVVCCSPERRMDQQVGIATACCISNETSCRCWQPGIGLFLHVDIFICFLIHWPVSVGNLDVIYILFSTRLYKVHRATADVLEDRRRWKFVWNINITWSSFTLKKVLSIS